MNCCKKKKKTSSELHNQWAGARHTQLFFFFIKIRDWVFKCDDAKAENERCLALFLFSSLTIQSNLPMHWCKRTNPMYKWLPTESAEWHLSVHFVAGGEEVKEGKKTSSCVCGHQGPHSYTTRLFFFLKVSPLWRFNTLTRCVSMAKREENEKRRLTASGEGTNLVFFFFFFFFGKKRSTHITSALVVLHWGSVAVRDLSVSSLCVCYHSVWCRVDLHPAQWMEGRWMLERWQQQ